MSDFVTNSHFKNYMKILNFTHHFLMCPLSIILFVFKNLTDMNDLNDPITYSLWAGILKIG
jgi:hypothetical protein